MVGLCRLCAYEKSDCKGNKDLEKCNCDYYKKPTVFNARQASEHIAELEAENNKLKRDYAELSDEYLKLVRKVISILEE